MSIHPLPVFEAEVDPHHRSVMSDEEVYARLEPPKTIVVKFGAMKMVGEFRYEGEAKPGCGTKLVARTPRGTEVVEMLTTTCENAGCSKSVTRKELRSYIENSGGRDFPFHTNGRVIRVASIEDLNKQSSLDSQKPELLRSCRREIRELGLNMKLVEVEPILGGELLTFYYMAEDRVDFRELVKRLAAEFRARIEMRQVGARDEARLTADYERCGQYCCCKGFLKVLKPVSMKSAKVQKATLDPLKISGRCGRLMCCLRYEDQTYTELKARLPKRNTRVGTPEGPGVVLDGKTLVQLVLVKLEHDGREVAIAVEDLMDPESCPSPADLEEAALAKSDPLRGMKPEKVREKLRDDKTPPERRRRRKRRRGRKGQRRTRAKARAKVKVKVKLKVKARAGRRRRGAPGASSGADPGSARSPKPEGSGAPRPGEDAGDGAKPRKRKRRRRGGRRRGGGGGGGGSGGGG